MTAGYVNGARKKERKKGQDHGKDKRIGLGSTNGKRDGRRCVGRSVGPGHGKAPVVCRNRGQEEEKNITDKDNHANQ